jgi:proline racemase
MRRIHTIDTIYTHTEGEPTCIVTGGIIYPAGSDILAKRRFLEENYDWLRCALMQEPRGHKDMYGVFVTPSSTPGMHVGTIWMNGSEFMHTCGHGTIATSMALVATGLVPATREITEVRFETTAGPVSAEVSVGADGVEWSRYRNVPTYMVREAVEFDLPEVGAVKADIVFSGNFFALIDWHGRSPKIRPEHGSTFARLGVAARSRLRELVRVQHPLFPHINAISTITFYHEPTRIGAKYRCAHVFGDGQVDRSPGGAGTAAMLAMLESRGKIRLGETVVAEGILGAGTFEGCLVEETKVGPHRAVIPQIKGRANIVGHARWLIDPDDPVGKGFVIG